MSQTTDYYPDASLFKEAFMKAQQENEPLFKEDADGTGESQKTEKADETKAE